MSEPAWRLSVPSAAAWAAWGCEGLGAARRSSSSVPAPCAQPPRRAELRSLAQNCAPPTGRENGTIMLFLSAILAQPARHRATFTKFCDKGQVASGDCWCKGGPVAAAIGDGSWLWQALVGAPCSAVAGDRCDCTGCGGAADSCPSVGCWQCEGILPPECTPPPPLLNCEVRVIGADGAPSSFPFLITEVCPAAHPCNRCKDPSINKCARWDPIPFDLCGANWGEIGAPRLHVPLPRRRPRAVRAARAQVQHRVGDARGGRRGAVQPIARLYSSIEKPRAPG